MQQNQIKQISFDQLCSYKAIFELEWNGCCISFFFPFVT